MTTAAQRERCWCVSRGMGEYGPASSQIQRLLARVEHVTLDEAADLYEAHAARILIHGSEVEREALHRAHRAARSAHLEPEYLRARHDAATAWRHALPEGRGPWLLVGQTIANAAGAMVVHTALEDRELQMLLGPWRMAMGSMEPVGPGLSTFARAGTR
ncbi:MAG TPA: hypothetical protein VF365_10660 [Candidatus Limnocylindria bacterium]